jgi:hypothetical protein
MTPTACPYCNALAGSELRDGRVVCKRCGEGWAGAPVPESVATASSAGPARPRRFSLFTVLALVAVGGVALSLWRPWEHSGPGPDKSSGPGALVRPTELPGLGYLPERTDTVLAVQVAAFVEALGPQAGGDPARAMTALGLPDAVVRTVESMSVVGFQNVDQIALGLRLGQLPPQITLVVRTRNRIDTADLDRQTKSRQQERDGRTLHAMKGGMFGDVYWWPADDRTLVVATLAKDFDDVPKQPRPGIGHLRPDLRRVIETQVAEDACFWLAAESDKWKAAIEPFTTWLPNTTILRGRRDLLDPADQLRSFAMSFPAAREAPAVWTITRKTAESADELRQVYRARFSREPIEVGGEGEVVRIQTTKEPGRLDSVFERLIGPKP